MEARTTSKIVTFDKLAECVKAMRQLTQGVLVFTNGAYDLLHDGHVEYLEDAAECGDCLLVGVNSDKRVQQQKGKKRPIQPEEVRVRVVAALQVVNIAFIYSDLDSAIELIRPNIIVTSPTTSFDPLMNRYKKAKDMGIEIRIIASKSKLHTSGIIERIRSFG